MSKRPPKAKRDEIRQTVERIVDELFVLEQREDVPMRVRCCAETALREMSFAMTAASINDAPKRPARRILPRLSR